jgi:rRNA processing protein Gar1
MFNDLKVYLLKDYKLTEENLKQLKPLIYDYDEKVLLNDNNYIGVIDNIIVIYCLIKESYVLVDKKLRYTKNIYNSIYIDPEDLKSKKKNDFAYTIINCLYNMKRNEDKIYKGIGIHFLNKLKETFDLKKIYLSASEVKLFNYYIKNNLKKTDYFDIDTVNMNYLRRILLL